MYWLFYFETSCNKSGAFNFTCNFKRYFVISNTLQQRQYNDDDNNNNNNNNNNNI